MVTPLRRKTEEEPKTIDLIDIPEEELNWSTVSLSEVVQRKGRLEASVYDIEGKHAREVLKNCRWKIVNLWSNDGFVETAFYPTRFKRIYVDRRYGIPFFLPSQINEIYPKANKFISSKTSVDFENIKVKRNTILLTRSGTVGECTVVSKTIEGKVYSDDVIRINLKNINDVGFVYAFLKSKIGKTLINTNNYGAVIDHIEPEHLENIPIPDPSPIIKHKIHEFITASFRLRDESNSLIDEAEGLLISELRLPPIDEIKPKYFDGKAAIKNFFVKLSKVDNRLDASYHVPIVEVIQNYLKKNTEEVRNLGELSERIILAGIFKRIYVAEGFGIPFLGGREILQLSPSIDKYLSTIHHKKRFEKELKVEENMLLISDRGTIGNVVIVPKHFGNMAVSQNIIKVKLSDAIAGFVFAFLDTEYGNILIKRETYGSVVDMIDDKNVSNIRIPLLKNKHVQQKINDLVLEAKQKRYEAYLLEQKAIKIVNNQVIHLTKRDIPHPDLLMAAEELAQYGDSPN
jgi:type I restriction enzyme S subunit